MCNTDPTKIPGENSGARKFPLLIRHPPCYSYIQTSPVKFLAVIEGTKKWYSGWREERTQKRWSGCKHIS